MEQLWGAIAAVFESWNTRRAVDYRRCTSIPTTDMGTAVSIVTMVYGNLGDTSGTGVAFSRNPSTGERMLFGEFLSNAQGEDVVSGARTPEPITALRDKMPAVYQEMERMARTLERHFRDVQDMEFTIEDGRLYMLQTRRAQRYRPGRVPDRVRHGGRGGDQRGGGSRPHSAPGARPTAASDDRPERAPRPADDRSPGLAWRRLRCRGV